MKGLGDVCPSIGMASVSGCLQMKWYVCRISRDDLLVVFGFAHLPIFLPCSCDSLRGHRRAGLLSCLVPGLPYHRCQPRSGTHSHTAERMAAMAKQLDERDSTRMRRDERRLTAVVAMLFSSVVVWILWMLCVHLQRSMIRCDDDDVLVVFAASYSCCCLRTGFYCSSSHSHTKTESGSSSPLSLFPVASPRCTQYTALAQRTDP